MAEKKTIELDIQSNLGSLRSQLREAQAEVAAMADKFGATSKQAQDAAKKAAVLKDKIQDAKNLTDAFNPDAKFGALTKSIGGAMQGFQAVQGAMGLFGAESAEVEKTLLKVQSAMALAQGVQGVMESVDSFKTLVTQVKNFTVVQKISTALQWLWNTAMEANPVIAIITAIVALLAIGYKLISWLMDSSEANETAAASVEAHAAAVKKQGRELEQTQNALSGANKFQYEYARAAGASAEQLRKLALKHAQEELALAKKNKELSRATYLREADILAMYRAQELSEDVINKQLEVVKKAKDNATKFNEIFVKENQELLDLKRQQIVEIRQEEEAEKKRKAQDEADRKKEQADNAKNYQDKLKEQKEKEAEILKNYNEKLLEYYDSKEKERQAKITDEQEKELQAIDNKYEELYAKADAANQSDKDLIIAHQQEIAAIQEKYRLIELEKMKVAEAEALKLKLAAEAEFQSKIDELDELNFQNSLKKGMTQEEYELELVRQKYFTLETLAEGNAEQLAIIEQAKADEVAAIQKKQDDKEKENAKKKHDYTVASVKDSLQMISDITTLFAGKSKKEQEKAFKIQKAVNIANAVVDTYKAANQALASAPPPFNFIAMGAAITAGLVNVKKITATKFEGGTPPTNDTTPSGGGGTSVMSPSFNVVGNSGLNQLAQLQQQPMKAYVVSGDVTSAQSLDRNRIENATLVQ